MLTMVGTANEKISPGNGLSVILVSFSSWVILGLWCIKGLLSEQACRGQKSRTAQL